MNSKTLARLAGALLASLSLGAVASPHAMHGAPAHRAPAVHAAYTSTDTTPPVLQAISVAGTANANQAITSVRVTLDYTDDLSGGGWGILWVQSPSGAVYQAQEFFDGNGALHVTHTQTIGESRAGAAFTFDGWSEPGTWRVSQLYLYDVAGNSSTYDADQLAALGPTTFTVNNTHYDGIAPVLVAARLLTSSVSLASGNDAGIPWVKASLTVSDTGTNTASGVDYVSVWFCKPPVDVNGQCADEFHVDGYFGTPAIKQSTITAGGLPFSTLLGAGVLATTGTYQIEEISVQAVDGNGWNCLTAIGGGACDASQWFARTSVTLAP
jgi:hypothetical protein